MRMIMNPKKDQIKLYKNQINGQKHNIIMF